MTSDTKTQTALKRIWLTFIDHPDQPRYPAGSFRWSLQRWWSGDRDRIRVGWDKERWEMGLAERRSYRISILVWGPALLPFLILSVIIKILLGLCSAILDDGEDVTNGK